MLIAGVDEVGRGPLAGAVVTAAVILDKNNPVSGLDDSKKLSEKKRELLFDEICSKALCWHIARAEVAEIDQLNILQATLLAMQRAVEGLTLQPQKVLVDGDQLPSLSVPAEAIIGGDGFIAEISAASIIAKVSRDREMCQLAKIYPGYGLEKHKGYGTKMHMQALSQLGPCEIHRGSFAPVKALL